MLILQSDCSKAVLTLLYPCLAPHTRSRAQAHRLVYRIEGLFKEAMTAALQLPLHDECTTALAFAAMLLNFASGDVANRALLATAEAVQLAGQLLQVWMCKFSAAHTAFGLHCCLLFSKQLYIVHKCNVHADATCSTAYMYVLGKTVCAQIFLQAFKLHLYL